MSAHSNRNESVCVVGVFPPPLHGLSIINEKMKDLIIKKCSHSIVIDLSTLSILQNLKNTLIRILKFAFYLPYFMYNSFLNKYHTLYIGLSGGLGQYYDLVLLFIAKLARKRIFIHHHSFSYLKKHRLSTNLIFRIVGKNGVHIALCNNMEKQLRNYRSDINCEILSNIVFMDKTIQHKNDNDKIKNIGFISNISFEKGIKQFCEIFSEISANNDINGIIAGPFQNNESKTYLEKALIRNSKLNYLGPLNILEKEYFYQSIDILIMPSLLEEAEPVVIHEAMSYGIPVIASNKGCIPEIIPSDSGLVISMQNDFVRNTINQIVDWNSNPKTFSKIKKNTYENFNNYKSINSKVLDMLISKITNNKI